MVTRVVSGDVLLNNGTVSITVSRAVTLYRKAKNVQRNDTVFHCKEASRTNKPGSGFGKLISIKI